MPNNEVSRTVDKSTATAANGMIYGTIMIFITNIFIGGIGKNLIKALVILQMVIHMIILNT